MPLRQLVILAIFAACHRGAAEPDDDFIQPVEDTGPDVTSEPDLHALTAEVTTLPDVPPPSVRRHPARVVANLLASSRTPMFFRVRQGDVVEIHFKNDTAQGAALELGRASPRTAHVATAPGAESHVTFRATAPGLHVVKRAGVTELLLVDAPQPKPPIAHEYFTIAGTTPTLVAKAGDKLRIYVGGDGGASIVEVTANAPGLQPVGEPRVAELAVAADATYARAAVAPAPAAGGEATFMRLCAACHQPNGRGIYGQFPPIAGSDYLLLASTERLIGTLLHGLQGPVTVLGTRYDGAMPPLAFLSDADAAAVLSYARGAFGNALPPITAAEVATVRGQTASSP